MKPLRILFVLTILGGLSAKAQPVITGVANAASFAVSGLPNANIALGSMFVIFGTGLGPASLTQVSSYPLPSTQGLAGTTVNLNTVSFAGNVDAIMIYTSATQVAAIVPSSLNFTGTVVLTVTYNGRTSNSFFLHLTTSTFGAFTVNQSGSGSTIAYNYNSDSDQPLNTVATPAKPGQVVTLWGTGLGPVKGAEAQGPLPGQMNLNLQVYVGGQQAQISYYGRSGCCSGIDQVVFAIPPGVAGCAVPVVVVVGGVPSNTSTIAVSSDGSTCTDVLGVQPSDVQSAAAAGMARFAVLTLTHTDGGNPPDSGGGDFTSTPFAQYAANPGASPALGSCLIVAGNASLSGPPSPSTELDAGASIQVSGPGGGGQLTKQKNGSYYGALGPLQAGTYNLAGSGGSNIGAFQASIAIPTPMTWTNKSSLTSITPGSPFTINWTGGDPGSYIEIIGAAANNTTNLGAEFACVSASNAGTFTVPGYLTAALPAGGGVVGLAQTTSTRFNPPGFGQGYLLSVVGSGVLVTVGASGPPPKM